MNPEPSKKRVPRLDRQDPFTGDEWALLRLAPALVSGGVGAADPAGLFTSIEQATAVVRGTVRDYRRNGRRLKLFNALAADSSVPGLPDAKTLLGEGSCEQQMRHFKTAALERVQAAVDLVARKGSAAEAKAYGHMIVAMAEKMAKAANERAFVADVQRAAGVPLKGSRTSRSAREACRHGS